MDPEELIAALVEQRRLHLDLRQQYEDISNRYYDSRTELNRLELELGTQRLEYWGLVYSMPFTVRYPDGNERTIVYWSVDYDHLNYHQPNQLPLNVYINPLGTEEELVLIDGQHTVTSQDAVGAVRHIEGIIKSYTKKQADMAAVQVYRYMKDIIPHG